MGGLRISAQAEVLEEVGVDSKGLYRKLRPIRGLFAAGEVRTEQHTFWLYVTSARPPALTARYHILSLPSILKRLGAFGCGR
jgi:hypothetical protein